MNKKQIIEKTAAHIKNKLSGEGTGHDWWHVYRVWQMAKKINRKEKGDIFVVEMSAFLHDIADSKFHGGDDTIGPRLARQWLQKMKLDNPSIDHIVKIIDDCSFKGAGGKNKAKTKEGQIVQDADRLDALGAIGIARAFATGGSWHRPLYDPKIKPKFYKNRAAYKKGRVQL